MTTPWALEVLGPTRVLGPTGPVPLRPRERHVLAALALRPEVATPPVELADVLWPAGPPATARVTLQNHVARARRALGAEAVTTEANAYRLGAGWTIDVDVHRRLVAEAARWSRLGRSDLAVPLLDQAMAVARGPAFVDLGHHGRVVAARSRHDTAARTVEDDLLVALVGCGATTRAIADGTVLAAAEPFREVRWAVLAVALHRDGQRREALRALQQGQAALRDVTGLEGGPLLRRIEGLLLDDDPLLLATRPDALFARDGSSTDPSAPITPPREATATTLSDLEAAARAALARGSFADAATLFGAAAERAVASAPAGPRERRALGLTLDRAIALRLAGDPACTPLVWEVIEGAEAVGAADTFARAATELCRLGPSSVAGRLDHEVAGVVERAIAGCTDLGTRASARTQAALFYSMTGHPEQARAHYELSLSEARATGDDAALLDALGGTYPILTHPADQARRAALAGEMLSLAERHDDDDGRFGALHLYFAVQVIGADPLLRTTLAGQEALARRLRAAARRWMVAYQRSCVAVLDGRLDDALEISEDAFATAPVAPSRAASTRWMTLLLVRVAQGRGQELTAGVDEVLADQAGLPGWRAVAAWLAALRGDGDRVAEECAALDAGRLVPPDMSWGGAVMLLGRAVAAVGPASANATLTDLLAPHSGLFSWYGSGTVGPFDLALAELALARDDRADAARHLARAETVVARLGAVVFRPDLDAVARRLNA